MQNPNQKDLNQKKMESQQEETLFPFTTNEQANQSTFTSEHASAQYDFVTQAGMPSRAYDTNLR
ncbi:MAG: hypothetical protein CL609_18635 [Anaerolineaceae bacterium]|nr:hypothetical protein [Anaerolineaceae bacterium]